MVGIKSQNSNFLQCVKNLVIAWQKPENLLILKTFVELKKEYDLGDYLNKYVSKWYKMGKCIIKMLDITSIQS